MLFFAGMMVGAMVGVIFMCLFVAAKDSDKNGE